jgi:hypothetical protein
MGGLWSDAANHATGHWLNGRISSVLLADVVGDIVGSAGAEVEAGGLAGLVSGYEIPAVESARASLQPLMLVYGFDAGEGTGQLGFRMRGGKAAASLSRDWLAAEADLPVFELTRQSAEEEEGRIRLGYVRAEADYQDGSVEIADPHRPNASVSETGVHLAMRTDEATAVAERWISEAAIARDRLALALPPSSAALVPGDVLEVELPGGAFLGRIDRIEDGPVRRADLVRVEAGTYRPAPATPAARDAMPAERSDGVIVTYLDLPLPGHDKAARVAVTSDPWIDEAAVYSSSTGEGFTLAALVGRGSVAGEVMAGMPGAEPDIWAGGELRVRVAGGPLNSASETEVLNGANVAAVRAPGGDTWEIIQFREAVLVGPDEYVLSGLLRGQAGTGFLGREALAAGSEFVLIDGSAGELPLSDGMRGSPRTYRAGPAEDPYDEVTYAETVWTWHNTALRPYAPVHIRVKTGSGGEAVFSWIRCTRVDGDSWEGREVPLGEEREAYLVTVNDGVRVVEVSGPEFIYTASDRLADGVTGAFTLDVAQISERFGAGPKARIIANG